MIGIDVEMKRMNDGCMIPSFEDYDEVPVAVCGGGIIKSYKKYLEGLINKNGVVFATELQIGCVRRDEEKSPESLAEILRKKKQYNKALKVCRQNLAVADAEITKRLLLKMALIYRAKKDDKGEFNARAALYTIAPEIAVNRHRVSILVNRLATDNKSLKLAA